MAWIKVASPMRETLKNQSSIERRPELIALFASEMEKWQRRRNTFSHDWMKNQYMPALVKCINVLSGRVLDPGFLKSFLEKILPQWAPQSRDLIVLIDSFKHDMSAARLIERFPSHPEFVERNPWIPALVHELWMNRLRVAELVGNARAAVTETTRLYESLREIADNCKDFARHGNKDSFRETLIEFRASCQDLTMAISKFPREISPL